MRRLKLNATIVVMILFSATMLFGEEVKYLSLKEAIELSLKNNLNVNITHQEIAIKEVELKKMKVRYLPNLTVNLATGYQKIEGSMEEPWIFKWEDTVYTVNPPLSSQWNTNLILSLSQSIYAGGGIKGGIRQAQVDKEIASLNYEWSKQELIFSTTEAYWRLKQAELLVSLNEKIAQQAHRTLELAEEHLKFNRISELEVKKAKVDLSNVNEDLISALEQWTNVHDELILKLRLPDDTSLILLEEPKFDLNYKPDLEKCKTLALAFRIEIKKAKESIKRKEASLMVNRSNKYPHINLIGKYNWGRSDKDYWKSLAIDEKRDWNIGLNLSYPIYDGGLVTLEIEQGKIELQIAEDELKIIKQRVEKEVKNVWSSLESSRKKIQLIKESLSLAEENLKIAQVQYKIGMITFDEVSDYQIRLKKISTKYIESLITWEIARLKLQKAVGKDEI